MEKKQIAVNKWFVFEAFLNIVVLCLSVACFCVEERGTGIFFAVFFAIGFVGTLFEPCCYIFDKDAVTIRYVLLKKEKYLWKNIKRVDYRYYSQCGNPDVLFLSNYVFEIDGNVEGEEKWYMKHYVRKSRKTKKLMEQYWDEIFESDFAKFKKKVRKKQIEKQKKINEHFADEVVKAEREVRARLRECAKPYIERAREHNLYIKLRFYYVTENGKELTSRPEEWYAYTACAEISYIGETDEDKKVFADKELLYVKLGKNGYKYTEVKGFEESFSDVLEDSLSIIIEKGIDFYCE
ncbi:MAG: hypothetical protein E7555_06835 [Ruminococcaceae bacterium]|nr:hypothetical protein [Oscillospiraceae bacterium]